MKNKNKELILIVLGMILIISITIGITYSIFNYTKEGLKENTITTGTIEFLYTEVDKQGAGISIENAYPMSDSLGKTQTASNEVFNFKVTSELVGEIDIPYEITARKKNTSTLDEDAVRIYLTEVIGDKEKELLLDNYGNLTQSSKVAENIAVEKTIYEGLVPTGSTNYEKNFRLRMWIDDSIKFTQNEDGTYPYNNKEFIITVNVYANTKVVTESEIDYANTTKIESLTVNGEESTTDNEDYDFYNEVLKEITEASINVKTVNSEAKVEVTKEDGTVAYKSTNIKRLSTIEAITLPLEEGNNIFNIKVISANGQVESEYSLNIFRKYLMVNLYSSGNEYTNITGGWVIATAGPHKTNIITDQLFKDSNSMYNRVTSVWSSSSLTTVNAIDMFNYSNLCFILSYYIPIQESTGQGIYYGIAKGDHANACIAAYLPETTDIVTNEVCIDISNVGPGAYYYPFVEIYNSHTMIPYDGYVANTQFYLSKVYLK